MAIHFDKIPAFGYKILYLISQDGTPSIQSLNPIGLPDPVRGKGVEVSFNPDGSINLHDLEQGINYENLNVFEDGADDGDEYDYAPLPEEEKIYSTTKEADYNLVKDNSVFTEIQAKIALEVPYELIGDLNSTRVRSKDKVSLKIKTSYKIYKSLKRVDISTDVVNKAKGHRLRALFPTGISATHSYADDHFIVMERTIEKPRDDGWYQNMQSLYHQDTFVDITSNEQSVGEGLEKSAKKQEGHGLAIFNKGLCEYEIIETPAQMSNNPSQQTKTHTIALTLFRSVAWLSQRGHLGRKSGLNGPNLQTPGAQMMDHEFHFEYSIFAHQGDWVSGRVYHSAHAYNSPPRLMNSDHKLRNEVLNVDIPLERSFLQIFNPNIVLSSFKRSHRIGNAKDGIILRVFNPCSTNQDTGIGLGFGVKRVFETDLLEKDCSEVPIEKDENEEFSHLLHLNIPEHKILTLRIEVDE